MKTATKTAKQTKQVVIIARAQFKSDPRKVCYLVRSSNGKDQYQTCLYDGKATGCGCPATKPCYHMFQVEKLEAERTAKAAREAAEQAQPAREKSEQARIADLDEVVQGGIRSEHSPIDKVFADGLEQLDWQKRMGIFPEADPWAGLDESARRMAYNTMFNPNNAY